MYKNNMTGYKRRMKNGFCCILDWMSSNWNDQITTIMSPLNPQTLLSALSLTTLARTACLPGKTCKAYPGSPDWPSRDQWIQLNGTIEGRLLQPLPPGAVCHEGWPTYSADQCPVTAANWSVYEFHTENPISIMWDHYANFTCLPDPERPCSVSGYPAFVVNATTAEHVKAGVDFGEFSECVGGVLHTD